jgi:hypothetical protein
MRLTERVFRCDACGLVMDRDRNAAANLAAWAEAASMAAAQASDRQAGGRVINAPGGEALTVTLVMVEPAPMKGEPTLPFLPEPRAPEKGGVRAAHQGCFDAL